MDPPIGAGQDGRLSVAGYQMFELAADMPEECESLRLRLRMQYTRVLDWADHAGLSDHADHARFDRKLQANRATILALLSEMSATLTSLRKLSLRYDELNWVDSPTPQNAPPPSPAAAAHGIPVADRTRPNYREDIGGIDFEKYQSVFRSPDLPVQRRHMRGFNHLIRIGSGIKDIASQPKRVLWALKDMAKFEDHLKRLKELTDFLHASVGDYSQEVLERTTRETHMAMLQLTSSFSQMKELLNAASAANIRGGDDIPIGHSSHSRLFEQLTAFSLASMEIEAAQAEEARRGATEIPAAELARDLTWGGTATAAADDAQMAPAVYKGEKVWVEWRPFKTAIALNAAGRFEIGPPPAVAERVARLVALLSRTKPVQFRAPICRGYFVDEDPRRARFGLLLTQQQQQQLNGGTVVAAAAEADGAPTTLHQRLLLSSAAADADPAPPLRARVALAQELAAALFFLHAVSWLHKSLRSECVLLFPATGDGGGGMGGEEIDYARPCVSGFQFARPDDRGITGTAAPDTADWAVYCHPDYLDLGRMDKMMGKGDKATEKGDKAEENEETEKKKTKRKGFRRSFDIYSLGIVLLEIAYWKPADQILGPELETVMDRLLVSEPALLQHVRSTMGDRYHSAVKACIEGLKFFNLPPDADESDPLISTLIQQAYVRLVVDVLQSIRV